MQFAGQFVYQHPDTAEVNPDTIVSSPREYLEHLIVHGGTRVRTFNDKYEGPLKLEELRGKTREELLEYYDGVTANLTAIFSNPANLTRTVELPYTGFVSGLGVLGGLRVHEANHEGANRINA